MPGKLVCGIENLAGDVRPLAVARSLSERLGLRLVTVHVTEPGADPVAEAAARRWRSRRRTPTSRSPPMPSSSTATR